MPRRVLLPLLGLLLVLVPPARAEKTDVVRLDNGDVITGEIKQLDKGKLRFKTDRTDDVYVEWKYVAGLTSVNYFEFGLGEHMQLFGRLAEIDSTGFLAIITDQGSQIVPVSEVVSIDRIQASFWARQDGSIDLGLTYQSSTDILQYTFSWSNKFRTKYWYWTIDFDMVETFQKDQSPTSRRDLTSNLTRYLGAANSLTGSASVQSNREQGIDLRTLASLAAGHTIVQSNTLFLTTSLGLSANHEIPVTGESTNNLEGLVSVVWSLFDYTTPKRSVDLTLNVYPGLTEWGRVRVDLNAKSQIEIIKDFYLGLTLLETYDSAPPADGSVNDLSLTFSLGYSY